MVRTVVGVESRPRILLVEDSADDAELICRQLKRSGLDADVTRIKTADEFRRALTSEAWDLVLSDYSLPRFSAPDALRLMQELGFDLPFIIVSGSVGEEVAVRAMKAGAHDFFAKSNLLRLAQAIEREIREASVRRQRRVAEEELRRAEERFRLMIESVRDHAIFMVDPEGNVASWNQGASRITGYQEDEILGQPLARFYLPEESARAAEHLREAAAYGGHRTEGFRLRKDGTRFWAESTLHPIREAGVLLGYSTIIRDSSERKQFLDDLREAVRARDEFMSIASHELRTPLTSLQLQIENLKRAASKLGSLPQVAKDVGSRVEVIARQSRRLTGLINSMLDVNRITSGRVVLTRESFDLCELVRDIVERAQDSIRLSGCALKMAIDGQLVGSWDRARIEAAISNLLSNAIKYGARKPVELSAKRAGDRVRVVVRDQGIGIPASEQARIFRRFERAVPEKHYGGFGLGLWLARQAVEAHGGSISVESREGKGSTFTIDLPMLPPPAEATTQPAVDVVN